MKVSLQKLKKWGPLAVLSAFIALAYAMGWHQALNFETLQAQKAGFQAYTAAHPALSALAFIAAYIVSVALSLPVATLLTLLGGFLFGKWLGTFFVVLSATLGASILFLIARSSLGASLREKTGALYKKIETGMNKNAASYLLFMRLVPLFPFVLVNIVPALFNVSLRVFVLTTFFGIIPGSFVYVNLGETLSDIESLNDLVSTQTLLAFGLLGGFALIPVLYKKFKAKAANTAAIMVALCVLTAPPVQAEATYEDFLTLYDGLLESYTAPTQYKKIRYNGVDYNTWAEDERHVQARDILLNFNPIVFRENDEKLSYWINTYNFLTIDLITRENEQKSIKKLGSFFSTPWEKHEWRIAGQTYTLDDIEHKILRPLKEPRIHFAINCAAVSCPDLRNEAYRVETLNSQLEDQVYTTLSNTGKGFDIHTDQSVSVSKIMEWFPEDFRNGDIKGWLKNYKPLEIDSKTEIEFLDYDWALNKIRKPEEK